MASHSNRVQAIRRTMSPSSTPPGPTLRRMAAWPSARSASRTTRRLVLQTTFDSTRETLTIPGQEDSRAPAGEPHRQPAQQDQGRKVPRPEAGEGRPPAGTAQEGPGRAAGEGEFIFLSLESQSNMDRCRKKRKRASPRSARRRSGKRITPTTSCSPRRTWNPRATRTGTRTGRTTSCSRLMFRIANLQSSQQTA